MIDMTVIEKIARALCERKVRSALAAIRLMREKGNE